MIAGVELVALWRVAAGTLVGCLVCWLLARWLRGRCCGAWHCVRRGAYCTVFHWPGATGRVVIETDDGRREVREYQSFPPPPSLRGPYCWKHGAAEVAHWTLEFSTPPVWAGVRVELEEVAR